MDDLLMQCLQILEAMPPEEDLSPEDAEALLRRVRKTGDDFLSQILDTEIANH